MRAKPGPNEYVVLNSLTYKHGEIHAVVDSFYAKVGRDELLSVPFNSVHDWPDHIEHMTHFWWTRFGGEAYLPSTYNPPAKHFAAGFNQKFLSRWLELFNETLNEHLSAECAQLWGLLAERMGVALTAKNEWYIREFGVT